MPPLTLDDSAHLLGHARWLEQRLFEVLGGWVQSTPDADAKLLFARHSFHHAWHAELLARCLPDTRDHDPETLTAPRSEEWVALVDRLAALEATAARVAGMYGVALPALIESYDAYLDRASAVRDAAAIRWVRIVVADEQADAADAAPVLEAAAADPSAADGRALERAIPSR
jgi:hypothetical protein